jgi:hypothetical protein
MTLLDSRIEVYCTYATDFHTWNIMCGKQKCLYYGSVFDIEIWLLDHIDTHREVKL